MVRHIENKVSIYGLFFNMSMKTETRISKYIARAGLASRRDAEKLIVAGRVSINGLATTNSWDCMKEGDTITLDGVKVKAHIKDQLFIFNKPIHANEKQKIINNSLLVSFSSSDLPFHSILASGIF